MALLPSSECTLPQARSILLCVQELPQSPNAPLTLTLAFRVRTGLLCLTGRDGFIDAQALVAWLLQQLDAQQHACTVKACLVPLLQLCIKACPHTNAPPWDCRLCVLNLVI